VEFRKHFKINIIQEDPFDRGRRAILDLGHTFAHAIEIVTITLCVMVKQLPWGLWRLPIYLPAWATAVLTNKNEPLRTAS
jgi:hypothetical protein